MLPAFLALVKPTSTKVKPACIKNTKIAESVIHNAPISPLMVVTAASNASF